jgi:PiT family inorganic phosphate transporter
MDGSLVFVLIIVGVAFAFDFINGFHDAANSIATVVSTRVLSPAVAVLWAAFFNFVAAFTIGTAVAKTVSQGLVDPGIITPTVVLAALLGAIIWDLLTWWLGLPSSSSHALLGGYAGAALAKAGISGLILSGWVKPIAAIVVSPVLGLVIALVLYVSISWLFNKGPAQTLNLMFRRLQLVSAGFYSLSHGANDAQKTMGIIVGLLVGSQALFADQTGFLGHFHLTDSAVIPLWVILGAHTAIAAGTAAGGWRIVKTMGTGITKLQPFGGFCAETGGAITILIASGLGIPVSTTHTITGAIVGVGVSRRMRAVRWLVAGRIVWAWILTIPAAAGIAAFMFYVLS